MRKTKSVQWGISRHFFRISRPFFSLFTFHSILHQGRHSLEKSKDLVVYFFAALIKHKIRMKYEKCTASVLYFVVCFVKTFAKYPEKVKYGKCIAGLMI